MADDPRVHGRASSPPPEEIEPGTDDPLAQAETILSMYEIRSPVSGTLQKIYKHPGEAVKSLETVFRIRIAEQKDN